MKKTTLLLIFATAFATAEGKIEHLLPKPKITTISEGHFPLNKKVRITAGESTPLLLEFAEICGGTTTGKNAPEIVVEKVASIDGAYDYTLAGYPDEAYSLKIEPRKVTIKATTETGVIRAVQTMMQLSEGHDGTPALECAEIVDWPAFKLRGFMHDVGRSYIPIEEIKREIELLSRFKVNTFHFHLTENQAWRFEVKKYPQLTADSSMSRFPGKYYTQEECRALETFAAERGVTIIPEIDMPGHNMGAIFSYPELTCEYVRRVNNDPALLSKNDKMKIEIWSKAGVSEALLCAGKKSTYAFFDDVLGELCSLFPSKRFHLGGDEAPAKCWDHCKDCQAFMKKQGLKNTQELMAYFFQRNFDALAKAGKTALYWYELDVPKYPRNAVMYAWRMGLTAQTIDRALREGYKVICCPGEYAYLDYPQAPGEPNHGWMPMTTLRRSYEFDPGYGRPKNEEASILGCEGTLWAEHLPTLEHIYDKAFPRALALVEAGWTPMARRNWDSFKLRAAPIVRDMRKNGVNAHWPSDVFGEEK